MWTTRFHTRQKPREKHRANGSWTGTRRSSWSSRLIMTGPHPRHPRSRRKIPRLQILDLLTGHLHAQIKVARCAELYFRLRSEKRRRKSVAVESDVSPC